MMKNIRYGTLATLVLSIFLLTACGNKSGEAVSSSAPSSSQVANSSSPAVSSKPSASKQASRPSQSRVVSAVSSSQDTVASSEASSAVETSSSSAAVTEVSSAPVAQGAVAPEAALVSGGNQLQSVEEPTSTDTVDSSTQLQPRFHPTLVSPGVVAGNWSSWSINSDGSVNNLPIAIVDYLPQESGIVHLHYMDTISGTGGYIHYYPAGVAIPFENFSDPTDISRERMITGNGGYLGMAEENLENLFYPNLAYRQ